MIWVFFGLDLFEILTYILVSLNITVRTFYHVILCSVWYLGFTFTQFNPTLLSVSLLWKFFGFFFFFFFFERLETFKPIMMIDMELLFKVPIKIMDIILFKKQLMDIIYLFDLLSLPHLLFFHFCFPSFLFLASYFYFLKFEPL